MPTLIVDSLSACLLRLGYRKSADVDRLVSERFRTGARIERIDGESADEIQIDAAVIAVEYLRCVLSVTNNLEGAAHGSEVSHGRGGIGVRRADGTGRGVHSEEARVLPGNAQPASSTRKAD